MKITLKICFFCLALSVFFCSCKKEFAYTIQEFGFLTISNQTTTSSSEISIAHNGISLNTSNFNNNPLKVPVGKGTITFKDKTGNSILDTTYITAANQLYNWVLFQPNPNLKPIIVENNQASEPKPEAGYIKVKAANFASQFFPNGADIVLLATRLDNYITAPVDTLENVTSKFEKYATLTVPNLNSINKSLPLQIIDSKTKKRLAAGLMNIDLGSSNENYSVFTIYIVESPTGRPVAGTTGKVTIKTLFSN